MKKPYFLLLLSLLLSGCTNPSEVSSSSLSSFLSFKGINMSGNWLRIAAQGEKIQNSDNVNYQISLGHKPDFELLWSNNYFKTNPGYGFFAIKRDLFDAQNNSLDTQIRKLPEDFYKDSYNLIGNLYNISESYLSLPLSYQESFSVKSQPEANHLTYSFVLIREDNSVIYDYLNCGYDLLRISIEHSFFNDQVILDADWEI